MGVGGFTSLFVFARNKNDLPQVQQPSDIIRLHNVWVQSWAHSAQQPRKLQLVINTGV